MRRKHWGRGVGIALMGLDARAERKTVDEAKEKLVSSGLDRKLVERFVQEIFGGKV